MKSKIIKKIMQWFQIAQPDFGLKKIILHEDEKLYFLKSGKKFKGF
jgi:hypothetical protein